MNIKDAQYDVRQTYRGGFVGQLVSSALWSGSAVAATWSTVRLAILILVVGGFFIFPVTTLVLRLTRGRASLEPGHPMNGLAMQVAFTLPLTLPLVGAAALYRLEWFYPAFMIALGAHYLPFMFLYGMRLFGGLSAALIGVGISLALWGPASFPLGAWVTAGILAIAALLGRAAIRTEERRVVTKA
jgi:hypothetical protein